MGERASAILPLLLATLGGQAQIWDIYDMQNAGLPSNTVNTLAVEDSGVLWAGTDWGLCRYDGMNWEFFQTMNSDIPDNDIRALAIDANGDLWVGMFIGGLAHFDGTDWTVFDTQNSPLPQDQIRALHFDPGTGALWIGTSDGLARLKGGDWRIYDMGPGSYGGLQLPGNNIASIDVRSDSLVCLGTLNAGYTYLTDTAVVYFNSFNNSLPDNTALGTAIDAAGDRWAACPAGGLLYHTGAFNGGVWFQYSTVTSLIPTNSLNAIVIDQAQRKIIGTQASGLTIYGPGGTWTTYNTFNSDIPDDQVTCLALNDAGGLWLGTTTGGLAYFDLSTGLSPAWAPAPLKVFPNPTEGAVRVEVPWEHRDGTVQVRDLSGRLVQEVPCGGRTIIDLDLASWASGTYAAHVLQRDGSLGAIGLLVRK